jgi:hypothetical protein
VEGFGKGMIRVQVENPTHRQRDTVVVDMASGGLIKRGKKEFKNDSGSWEIVSRIQGIRYELASGGIPVAVEGQRIFYRDGVRIQYGLKVDTENVRFNPPAESIPDTLFEILPQDKEGITIYDDDLRMEVRDPAIDEKRLDRMMSLLSDDPVRQDPKPEATDASQDNAQSSDDDIPRSRAASGPSALIPQSETGAVTRYFWITLVAAAALITALAIGVLRKTKRAGDVT